MSADRDRPEGFSLRRWSQRKLEAARTPAPAEPAPAIAKPIVAPATSAGDAVPAAHGDAVAPAATALPPVETLTFNSDFTAFLQPKVEEALRRTALRKLFRDPRFNVMDGLDVYIDDYSIPDPIAPEVVRELMQSRYIFDPPPTRISAEGFVEDIPPDERDAGQEVAGTAGPAATVPADETSAAAPLPSPDADAEDLARLAEDHPAPVRDVEVAAPILPDSAAQPDR